jgi:CHAT domain-containing protein/tetratricopeptide (TPR) repeat protein
MLAAPALSQAPPPVDRALMAQFVSASESDRGALLRSHPEISGAPFREALASAASSLRGNSELDAAEQHYRALLFVADQQNLPAHQMLAINGLGVVAGMRGDLAQATEHLHTAMAIAERTGDRKGLQAAWTNLGIVQRKFGELDLAEESIRRSIAIADVLHDKGMKGKSLNNLGNIYRDRGDGATALDYLLHSLQLKQEADLDAREVGLTLSNIGGLFDEQGDSAQALHYYLRGLDLMQKAGAPDTAMVVPLNNLGHVNADLGKNAEARAYYSRARAATEKSGQRGVMATTIYNIANLAEAEGNLAEADRLHFQALAIREELGDRIGIVESLSDVAHILDRPGRAEEALPYALRAVSLAQESRLPNQLWKAQFAEGHIRASLGQIDLAEAAYTAAIATIERLRQNAAGGDAGRRQYFAEQIGPYYALATLKAARGDGWGALGVMEQSRARALVDIIASGRQPARQLTEAQQRQERALIQAVTAASEAIDAESRKPVPSQQRLATLDAQLMRARTARDVFTSALYAERPDLQFARGNAPAVTRDELAALIRPSTAVVSFVFDSDGPWVYLLRRNAAGLTVTTKKLGTGTDVIAGKAEAFAQQIASRDLRFAAPARDLYKLLLGPIDNELAGAAEVVVIPDGPFWAVPFQALITTRGKFMIEEHALSYTASLSALSALEARRSARAHRPPFLLALGDPVIDGTAAPSMTRSGRGSLPEAAREVQALRTLYGASRSKVLTAAAASESAFRGNLTRASVVHLATHGILDDRNPMYSRVLLTADRSAGGVAPTDHASDGRLEAWEILDLGFTADLAVLSACKTARGRFGWGEGVVGLSWSMFAAGASTAIVSQWEVDSASTTSLMIGFHRRLLAPGKAAAAAPDALRQAAIALMKNPAYRHPFYWAGFISVGAR